MDCILRVAKIDGYSTRILESRRKEGGGRMGDNWRQWYLAWVVGIAASVLAPYVQTRQGPSTLFSHGSGCILRIHLSAPTRFQRVPCIPHDPAQSPHTAPQILDDGDSKTISNRRGEQPKQAICRGRALQRPKSHLLKTCRRIPMSTCKTSRRIR